MGKPDGLAPVTRSALVNDPENNECMVCRFPSSWVMGILETLRSGVRVSGRAYRIVVFVLVS